MEGVTRTTTSRVRDRDSRCRDAWSQLLGYPATMAVRICPAHSADVKSGPTGSAKMRSLMVLSVLRWRIFWYSGEEYQAFALLMSGNSD